MKKNRNVFAPGCRIAVPIRLRYFVLLLLAAVAGFSSVAKEHNAPGKKNASPVTSANIAGFKRDLLFVENKGQITDQYGKARNDIDFKLAATGGLNIFIGNGAIHYQFSKCDNPEAQQPSNPLQIANHKSPITDPVIYTMDRMDVELVGANENAKRITDKELAYYENYFTASVGEKGVTAHSYGRIIYKDVYPHIDWVLYTTGGQLKHEFVVHEGGKVSDIKLKYGGASELKLDKEGKLVAETPQGAITEQAPYSYDANKKQIGCSFSLHENILTYNVADHSGTLVLDPSLSWGTYFGGSGLEDTHAGATDGSGNVFVGGGTASTSGIATTGAYQTTFGGSADGFLAKFNGSGTIQWATYIGGASHDEIRAIAADASGDVFITGFAASSGLATSGAHQTALGGGNDAFLAKFTSSGSILWCTYYGGAGNNDLGFGVATDASGNVFLSGCTESSSGIATSGAHDVTYSTVQDAFLAKFNSGGTLLWGTYYGGVGNDIAFVATDGTGNAYLTGSTGSTSAIATTGAHQTTFGGGSDDGFVAKFSSAGVLLWGTYYGGSSGDAGGGAVIDGSGNIYVAGTTASTSGIATSGAYQVTYGGGTNDAYLVKFNSAGVRQWGTYYGGSGSDVATGVAADGSGNIYIEGPTSSTSAIATTGAYQTTMGGSGDAFLAAFNATGSRLWGTYYGGPGSEQGLGVATDGVGNVFVTGWTTSTSAIATTGAYQTSPGGSYDAFVAKFYHVGISGSGHACAGGAPITFVGYPAGGTWISSSPTIATVGSSTGIVTPISGGTITVTYTTSAGVATTIFTVDPLPTVFPLYIGVSSVDSLCSGAPGDHIILGMSLTGVNYQLVRGVTIVGGPVSGIGAPLDFGSHPTPGVYTVVATNTATGCTIAMGPVTILASPAAIGGPGSVCVGSTITLTDATTGGTWSASNTNASVGSSTGIVTGAAAGVVIISYTLGTGCFTTKTVTVNVVPPPITGITSVCAGGTVTAVCGLPLPGGIWTTTIGTVNPLTGVFTGSAPGTGSLCYTYSTGCTSCLTVTVNPSPAPIVGTFVLCQAASVTLTDVTPGGTWTSSVVTVATVGSASGIVSGTAGGNTTISYTLPVTGCFVSQVLTVNPLPPLFIVAALGSPSLCPGDTGIHIRLSGSTTGVNYQLMNGGSPVGALFAGTGTIVDFGLYSAAGAYTVYATNATTGCARSMISTVTISYGVSPTACAVTGGGSYCSGGSPLHIGLACSSIGVDYQLFHGSSTTGTPVPGSGGPIDFGTFTAAGTYTVTATSATSGCSAAMTGSAIITVGAAPILTCGPTTLCLGESAVVCSVSPSGGTWTSSATTVATVGSTSGLVTGVGVGAAVITYLLPSGCYATTSVNVTPSTGTVTPAAPTVCQGSTTTLTTSLTGGTWSSGAPTIASVGSATGIVNGIVPGTAVITYTSGGGCTANATVTVNPLPTAFIVTGGGSYCDGGSGLHIGLSGSAIGVSYELYLGGVPTGIIVSGTGTPLDFGLLSAAGTYTVRATNAAGCSSIMTGSATITINPPPPPIGGPGTVCLGATITKTNAVPGGTWTSGSPGIASIVGTSGVTAGVALGTAPITYMLPTGCYTTTIVTVSLAPTAILGSSTVCAGSTTLLTDGVSGGLWTSSGGATVGSLSGVVTGVTAGPATITYSLGTGCTVTRAMTVNVSPAPVTGTLSVCMGGTTTLSNTTPGGTWTSAATTIATIGGTTGVVNGILAGTATISYTTSSGCAAMAIVTVNATPGAIGGAGSVCVGGSTTLTVTPAGGTWSSTSSTVTVGSSTGTVNGVLAGPATITYTLPTGCRTTRAMTVNTAPTIVGPGVVCVGSTATLTGSGGGTWSSSSPTIAGVGSTTGVVMGIAAGIATITFTPLSGCVATKTMTVTAAPTPIMGTLHVCVGSTTTLTNGVGGGVWTSSALPIATIGSTSGVVNGIATGTSIITYSLGTGCRVTAIVTVNATPPPITGTASVCIGSTTTLTSGSGGAWTSGSTPIATVGATTGIVSGVSAGVAMITYTPLAGCTATRQVTVHALPGAITGTASICVGMTTTLSSTPTGGTWTSSNPVIASAGSSSGVVSGINTGTATITYTTAAGCRTTRMVSVQPAPPGITGPTTVCMGATITLSNSVPWGLWTSGNIAIATVGSTTGVVSGSAGGTVTISYTVPTGCVTTRVVNVNDVPPLTGLHNLCAWGDTLTVHNSITTGLYSSSLVTVINLGSGNGRITTHAPGTATITYLLPSGCSRVTSFTVNPLPATITGTVRLCPGTTTTLSNITPGGVWSSGTPTVATIGSATGIVNGIAIGTSNITYKLPVTGCLTDTVVTVVPPPSPILVMSGTVIVGATNMFMHATPGGTWTSSAPSIASIGITSGIVTGVSLGMATITYTIPAAACPVTRMVNVVPAPSIHPDEDGNIRILPNPNKGVFTITGTMGMKTGAMQAYVQQEDVWIEVTDMLGRTLYTKQVQAHYGQINEEVVLLNRPANGMYIVSLRSANERRVFHIMVSE